MKCDSQTSVCEILIFQKISWMHEAVFPGVTSLHSLHSCMQVYDVFTWPQKIPRSDWTCVSFVFVYSILVYSRCCYGNGSVSPKTKTSQTGRAVKWLWILLLIFTSSATLTLTPSYIFFICKSSRLILRERAHTHTHIVSRTTYVRHEDDIVFGSFCALFRIFQHFLSYAKNDGRKDGTE